MGWWETSKKSHRRMGRGVEVSHRILNTPELKAAWELLKPLCVEIEYIENGTFQGGEEDCFVAGIRSEKPVFVFQPDAVPYVGDDE